MTYGSIEILPIEFMQMDFDDTYDVRKIPKFSGESYVMSFGYEPREININLRFNSFYTESVTPDYKCGLWYAKAQTGTTDNLIVANVNYGNYIIEKIRTIKRNFIPVVNDLNITFCHVA
jgi:hypothetical protein